MVPTAAGKLAAAQKEQGRSLSCDYALEKPETGRARGRYGVGRPVCFFLNAPGAHWFLSDGIGLIGPQTV
jgi:hypothetical protein